jgi:hypothetical protein
MNCCAWGWQCPPRSPPQTPASVSSEEWLTATRAVERAEAVEYALSLSLLNKYATKGKRKARQPPLNGNHKLEVEWNSLAGHLLRTKAGKARGGAEEAEAEPTEAETAQRIREEGERKRRGRSLD